jgi:Thioesterase-like superfamily
MTSEGGSGGPRRPSWWHRANRIPAMSVQPVFEVLDGRLVATELARGPWDPNAQHGGAPAALLARAFERLPGAAGLSLARVTYEFLRPVPIGPVELRADVTRPGRRVQLLDGSMLADGVEVVRARALRVLAADSGRAQSEEIAPPPGPEEGRTGELPGLHRPRFATDAIEIRFVAGAFGGGPGTAWFRLARPLVGDEEPSAVQRLAAASDFGAGLSGMLPREDYLFINPDLTLYVEREPVGEWICLESQTRIAAGGIGVADSVLYDERGRVGRATQALLVARH